MKIKSLLSFVALFAFAMLGGGSFEDLKVMFWIFLIVFIFMIPVSILISNLQEQERQVKEEEERVRRKNERKAKEEMYYADRDKLYSKYGDPDKTISTQELNMEKEINVFESKRIFVYNNKAYNFADVISCTLSDSPTTIKGKVTAVTTASNGSTIGRSIVGGLVAGSTGAIIGGATAKKNTEFHQENDQVIHDYTVIIYMNSISNPVLRIPTHDNGNLTNEILALMNVIIQRR